MVAFARLFWLALGEATIYFKTFSKLLKLCSFQTREKLNFRSLSLLHGVSLGALTCFCISKSASTKVGKILATLNFLASFTSVYFHNAAQSKVLKVINFQAIKMGRILPIFCHVSQTTYYGYQGQTTLVFQIDYTVDKIMSEVDIAFHVVIPVTLYDSIHFRMWRSAIRSNYHHLARLLTEWYLSE